MDISRSTLRLFVAKSGNALLFFGGIILFARWLGGHEMGIFFLFLTLLGLFSIPADLGIRGALEKRLSEGRAPERTLGSALGFKLLAFCLLSVCILAAGEFINEYVGYDVALLLIVGLGVRELAEFYAGAVRGELRVGETAALRLSRRLVWLSTSVLLVWAGFGVLGLLVGAICGRFVEFLWGFVICQTAIGRPSMTHLRSLFAFSKYQTVLSVGGRIYQWTDVAIIGLFLSQYHVSAYEYAWQTTLLVLLVSQPLGRVLFPQISRWDATASTGEIESAISRLLGFAMVISVPAVVGSVLYAEPILGFIFGPETTIAATALVVLMVEKCFQSFNDVVGSSIRAIDRPDLAARATVLSVGLNLLVSPVLVVWIGLLGAALGTTLSWAVNTAVKTYYLRRHVSFTFPRRLLGWYVVVAALMGCVLVGFQQVLAVSNLVVLCLHVSVGVAVYAVGLAASPDVRARIIRPGLRTIRS